MMLRTELFLAHGKYLLKEWQSMVELIVSK